MAAGRATGAGAEAGTSLRRPMINPALRRVWRDGSTLQLGTDPGRAVVIGGLDRPCAQLVERVDGTHDLAGLRAVAARLGVPAARADHLLGLLERSGVLHDGAADHRALARLSQAERDRLQPDLAAASATRAAPDGGAGVLGRRRDRIVVVHGAGRLGAAVVRLLAAAGVGTIGVVDPVLVGPADLGPAGLGPDTVGARRDDAAARSARALSPSVRARPAERIDRPDLVVLAPDAAGPDRRQVDQLMRDEQAHLFAAVRPSVGVVGPLVLPGRSSCARCHDLHRRDRDAGWPTVAAQLRALPGGAASRAGQATRSIGADACDVVLATAVAAQTCLQVLAFLDGGTPAPPAVDGTIEVSLAEGSVRRRSWSVHPSCGCGWPSTPGPVAAG
ncbi:MAG TPA: ThiF family adenylyltransferase [Actinomycetes bacterium]|nr:ThiF family adenylyltransferase [Actinomycetes bacterium]